MTGASPEALYAPVIADDTYGPTRVSVEAQRQDSNCIWNAIRHMLLVRKTDRVFGWGELQWLGDANDQVAAFVRRLGDHAVIALHNLADVGGTFELQPHSRARDLLTGTIYERQQDRLQIKLEPYQYLWLQAG